MSHRTARSVWFYEMKMIWWQTVKQSQWKVRAFTYSIWGTRMQIMLHRHELCAYTANAHALTPAGPGWGHTYILYTGGENSNATLDRRNLKMHIMEEYVHYMMLCHCQKEFANIAIGLQRKKLNYDIFSARWSLPAVFICTWNVWGCSWWLGCTTNLQLHILPHKKARTRPFVALCLCVNVPCADDAIF